MNKKLFFVLGALLIVALALAACQQAPAEPETVTVVETVVVVEEKEGETITVVETVEVEAEMPTYSVSDFYASEQPWNGKGAWVDEVSMSIVSAEAAITQIEAGAVDLYASNLSTPQDVEAADAAGLERSMQFGIYYELTFNPVGPEFPATGKLNPFSSAEVRKAMNWLVDRDYMDQEIYGGLAVPKWFSLVSGFPDYARHADIIRGLEATYSYNYDKAVEVIDAEMTAMGATKAGDKWTYNGEPVELIFLIRNDSDGTRVPIGDYVSNQLESIGFTVDRQYKTSSEASPLWVLGDPADGLWHIYTGAWGSGAISRDDGGDFQFFYTIQSGYAFSPLWQTYEQSDEFTAVSEALANKTFSTMAERRELFSQALEMTFDSSYRVWLEDGVAFSAWRPELSVAFDLSAGVDINALWPFTLRFDGQEGGSINWGTPDLFVDPANPVAGSNWTYDSQWQLAVSDFDAINNPYTGVSLPQRLESAQVTLEEGLPVGQTYDWVTLEFAPEIVVPDDMWASWDPETGEWITVGDYYTETQTAKRHVVYTYPADLFDTVYWHDGSQLSPADFLMGMVMTFAPGTEGSPVFDESQAAVLESFRSTFKGFKMTSTDPLTFELYSDTWFMDAEANAVNFRAAFWPEYGYGNAPWHMMAVSNLAEEAQALAYSSDKSTALEIEWMNFIGGPSLGVLSKYLDQAYNESYVPFEPILGEYITPEQAQQRYFNLKTWFGDHGHYWVGTGPFYLDAVYLVEKTLTLKHNPYYVDDAGKWDIFAAPKLATAEVDGPGRVAIGEEAVFDVYLNDPDGNAYPGDEVSEVKYILYDATGAIVEVAAADFVSDGYYTITLSADTTGALAAGSNKLEIVAVVIPVSIPGSGIFEFVTE